MSKHKVKQKKHSKKFEIKKCVCFVVVFVLALILISSVFLLTSNSKKLKAETYQKYYYVTKDATVRGLPSIKSNIKLSLIKGTRVKFIRKVQSSATNTPFYEIEIDDVVENGDDGMFYSKERTFRGYVLERVLSDVPVARNTADERVLKVIDKTSIVKNVDALYKNETNTKFKYASVSKKKSDPTLRSSGYNFVINGKTRNDAIYYFDCSSFVSTVLKATFGVNVIKSDNDILRARDYVKYAEKGNKFDIIDSATKKGGSIDTSKLQIGDIIVGLNENKKPDGTKRQDHILIYIGDSYVAHSTYSYRFANPKNALRNGIAVERIYSDKAKVAGAGFYTTIGKNVKKNHFDSKIYILRLKKDSIKTRKRIRLNSTSTKFNIEG